MIPSQELLQLLAKPKVNIHEIEAVFQTQGKWLGDFYYLYPKDPSIAQVLIGFDPDHKREAAEPEYVEIIFNKPALFTVMELLPSCIEWKEMPFITRASPYPYRCMTSSNTSRQVRVSANLTGEVSKASSRAESIIFSKATK